MSASIPLKKTVMLAAPRGFCAGVDRAISIVEKALQVYKPPLYVNHEIVHNIHVVNELRKKGVIFVEDLSEIPDNSTVIFSAHGVSPSVWEQAKNKNLEVIDATCPLVTKVHIEARRYARENYKIVLIGHKDHVEAKGTWGEAPEKIFIVESMEDIEKLEFKPDDKLAYLTQTTLSVLDTKDLITSLQKKFPQIEGPSSSDICYATTNRQEAVAAISPQAGIMLVIGSRNSSNSNRLRELAQKNGAKAYLIDNAQDIQASWFSDTSLSVGVTAGASAPEKLVREVLDRLTGEFMFDTVNEIKLKEEDIIFQLPAKLRQKISS